jgi:hypothetical protein
MNPSYYLALLEGKRLMNEQFEPPAPHWRKRPARTRRAWRGWLARPVSRLRPEPTS